LIHHKTIVGCPADRTVLFCRDRRALCYVKTMLVAITCPACRHNGYAVKSTLPRVLLCSQCGSRKSADRRSTPPRPSFVEQSLLPDDLVQLLWNDQFPFRRSLREGRWPDK
jgi:hypothetical protein